VVEMSVREFGVLGEHAEVSAFACGGASWRRGKPLDKWV